MIRKPQIYLIIALIFLILILFTLSLLPSKKEQAPAEKTPAASSPVVNNLPSKINPILTEDIPLKSLEEGGGVDLSTSLVQDSQIEVTKTLPLLPYENEFVSANGKNVSIIIPNTQFQETPWVLDVQIFGIDYQANPGDKNYTLEKNSFLEASNKIFKWMKSQGINPEKIIINWGDKAYIRESAENWLSQ